MLIKHDKHSFNVYCIDPEELTIELWNHYGDWRMLWRQQVSARDMIDTLYNAARFNQVVTEEECNAMIKVLEAAE